MHVDNTPVFSVDLTKDRLLTEASVVAGCLQLSTPSAQTHLSIQTGKYDLFWPTLSSGTNCNPTGSWSKSLRLQIKLTSRKVPSPNSTTRRWTMGYGRGPLWKIWCRSISLPESVSSSNSRELNAILNKLAAKMLILRDLLASGADQATVQARKTSCRNL